MMLSNWLDSYVNPQQRADKSIGIVGGGVPSNNGLVPPGGVGGIKCLPRIATFTANKHPIVKTFARFVPAGGGGSTAASNAFKMFVYTPSNRLRLAIAVVFEPDTTNLDVAYQAGNECTWAIRTMARNPQTGKESALQLAYPSSGTRNLPDAYEADTAAELLRVDVTLKHNAFSTSYVAASESLNCNIQCTWEPNIVMSEKEFFELAARCDVSVSGQPLLIQNDAA